ncbi:MAG: peptidase T [Tannerellaceae bacterium]|jgi:tripeptide aminopeptidase|nr:peptidase T [Tannerellaceae bacterium]
MKNSYAMNISERFLRYVAFDTQSDEASSTVPSTAGQRIFAEALADELRAIGMEDVELNEKGYLMATLPANSDKAAPVIGFIAHLDTSPDMSGRNVQPRIVHYGGGEIVLSEQENIRMSPAHFPELSKYVGHDLIVTDGTTLLGADDKAGVAAIVSAMQYLLEHDDIKHGKVRIAFTPDEEIGRGVNHFDVKKFGCEWAYTVDGGEIGELEYENFNAATAEICFKGLSVHPGYAKGIMLNAALLAAEYVSWLPTDMRPESTEGYEGFFHLISIRAGVEEARLVYLVREHDSELFGKKKELLSALVERMNGKYPESSTLSLTDTYYNMYEQVAPHPHIINLAAEAMRAVGVEPIVKPMRGGTDGARLSFMGLPCPNIFAGGHNFHGRYEFIPISSLEKSMQTIIKIIDLI